MGMAKYKMQVRKAVEKLEADKKNWDTSESIALGNLMLILAKDFLKRYGADKSPNDEAINE